MFGRRRDPRQARFVTWDSLRWVVRNRAWNWWYLQRYWRFFWFRMRHPHIITEGFVFIGRRVEIHARKGYSRMILGRWVHVGDENRIRAHEGTMRIGDKCVFGRDNTINGYLDVEIGEGTIIADWVYICDFDHVYSDVTIPIKDQGIVKSPVRIGPDCWLGAKVTVTRGTRIGHGSVIGSNAVVRGEVPAYSIAAGIPARVLKDRRDVYAAGDAERAALDDIARKTRLAAEAAARGDAAAVEAAARPGQARVDPGTRPGQEGSGDAPST